MTTKTKCPYCKGTGKDFFELLAPISFCLVCNGSGTVELEIPYKECVFCSGTGKNPLGARVTCIVCGGKGSNTVKIEPKACEKCKATGRAVDGLPCTICRGTGYH